MRSHPLMRAGVGSVATATLFVISVGCEPARSTRDRADLVLTGGRVVTVDPGLPEAEAVAIRGDRILAVGTATEIAAYVSSGTQVVELGGRLVIPGFIESHGHFVGLGDRHAILDFTTVETWEEIVALVAEAARIAEPGEWIRGRGWHQEKWNLVPEPAVEGVPVHGSLSAVSPENPVLLTHASGHAAIANARALELAGIDRNTPDPEGGTIVHDATGEPSGLLRELAQELVSGVMAQKRDARSEAELDAEFRERVRLAGQDALSKGVTSFHDAGPGAGLGSSFQIIERLRRLADEGALPVRLYVMVRGEPNDVLDARLPAVRMIGYGNGFLTVRAVKKQIDGALGSHGAWLFEPYQDMPGSTGLVLEGVEEIEETARIALRHGFQLNTHAIGDRANREVLDLYERAFAEAGIRGDALRWRIEHVQHLHPSDVPRFRELGVIAAMQAVHATSDGPWVSDRIGDERARTGAYVWRDLLDAGVVIVNGTDAPIENLDPIPSFHASVARVLSDGSVFYGEQRMTREEALRSYTRDAAYAAFEEDIKGTITPGKLADMVVLSHDILRVPIAQILDARVDLTILGGEVRYTRAGLVATSGR